MRDPYERSISHGDLSCFPYMLIQRSDKLYSANKVFYLFMKSIVESFVIQ